MATKTQPLQSTNQLKSPPVGLQRYCLRPPSPPQRGRATLGRGAASPWNGGGPDEGCRGAVVLGHVLDFALQLVVGTMNRQGIGNLWKSYLCSLLLHKNQPQKSWTALFTSPFANRFSTLNAIVAKLEDPGFSLNGWKNMVKMRFLQLGIEIRAQKIYKRI